MMQAATEPPAVDRFRSSLTSPIGSVSSGGWRDFYTALELEGLPDGRLARRLINAVSPSGGLGSYDMRPRRLVELGYATGLRYEQTKAGRCVHACDFTLPFTKERFLSNPILQLQVLGQSMARYEKQLSSGEIQKPKGMSLAGALAILHRGGKGALAHFPDLFPDTRALYERAQGAF